MASSWFGKILGKTLTLGNLEGLLSQQLQDLYSAEEQLISALPKMAEAASSSRLKTALMHRQRAFLRKPADSRGGNHESSGFSRHWRYSVG